MIIKRDRSIEEWLFNEVRTTMGKHQNREGIHLSDCLTPRKAYWQKVKPMPLTDDEIMYFTTGKGHENVLLYVAGFNHGLGGTWYGIHYTPDLYHNFPAEVKTRRRKMAQEGEEAEVYELYLKQLKGYCAVTDKPMGWLWVWGLAEKVEGTNKTKPCLHCFSVEFTEEELIDEKHRLINIKALLENSIKNKNHTLLPYCPEWMCVDVSTQVIKKPYCFTCKKEFQKTKAIFKHSNKGHRVDTGSFERKITPKCKYYEGCIISKEETG